MRGIELETSKPPVTEETPDEKALDFKPLFQPIETVYAAKRENEKFDAWAKKWIAEAEETLRVKQGLIPTRQKLGKREVEL